MIAEKLIELSKYYTKQPRNSDELISFCNQFDVIYSNFTNELEQECDGEMFEMLDSIFMICDSYESNEEIRANESYCIGEKELQKKVLDVLLKLDA